MGTNLLVDPVPALPLQGISMDTPTSRLQPAPNHQPCQCTEVISFSLVHSCIPTAWMMPPTVPSREWSHVSRDALLDQLPLNFTQADPQTEKRNVTVAVLNLLWIAIVQFKRWIIVTIEK